MQNSSPPTSITYMEVPIQFREREKKRTTNFLDLLLKGKEPMNKDEIHHKHIYADTTTNFFSNHPTEHKIAAYRYFITCMRLLLLSLEEEE